MAVLVALSLLTGCAALRDVLPGPPVVTGRDRTAFDVAAAPRTADGVPLLYTTAPVVPYPVLPVQVWGLRYALDLVLVSDHPDWVMHEYARIDLPDRSFWLAKDAGRDREQTITADIPDIQSWVPEAPVHRREGTLTVTDHSAGTDADLRFQYTNPLGQTADVHYVGKLPTAPSNPRNGNTMGHSRASVAALLDLYLFRVGGHADVVIEGVARKLHKLVGLLPEAYLLAQVQGGFAVADFCQDAATAGFTLTRPCNVASWPTSAHEAWTLGADGWAERPGPVVTLRYHYVEGELDRAQAIQAGSTTPLVNVQFTPRVPDVRRKFAGTAVSGFVVDVNGQLGHGTGCVSAAWGNDEVHLEVRPDAPRWFADRPLVETVRYTDQQTWVHAERQDLPEAPSCGR